MSDCFHVWEEAGGYYLLDDEEEETLLIWQCCLCGKITVTDENQSSPLPQASGN
jgi:hypothetical protein